MQKGKLCFIDLFAGAGGLSEGFMQEGFVSVAHVEMDERVLFIRRMRYTFRLIALCRILSVVAAVSGQANTKSRL